MPATAATASACGAPSPDYGPPACWIPADPSNYSVANRAHDYPIDMIVIHDTEVSYGSAIQLFQTAGFAASAHYVVSYGGDVTQMVREKDIAWHAGNWDYNTRSIGIEHEGLAWTPGLYTTAEYNASAAISASICSRWGVQMDRAHVIGHNEVPDPNNPGLYGGSDHHTDPGPYWDWSYYMAAAQADARNLPSPPHIMPDPVAVNGTTSANVTWQPARTCRPADAPITGYTVVSQPGNLTMYLPATATSATFNGLQPGTSYTFTVTAQNSYGQGSGTSNPVIPGRCNTVGLSPNAASPQPSGTQIRLTASSNGCPNPLYQFWMSAPNATSWQIAQPYSSSPTFAWNTTGTATGTYGISVWARDAGSSGTYSNSTGSWDDYSSSQYTLTMPQCSSAGLTASPASPATVGTNVVNLAASASGCPNPVYQFWMAMPGGNWQIVQPYSTSASFAWNTSGSAAGTYSISVWVRDAYSAGADGNNTGHWDAYTSSAYTLSPIACSAAGLSGSPAATATAGTKVILTATASGCPNPLYQFWMAGPGESWQVVQAYSSNSSFTWDTAGAAAGSYSLSVWVRDASGTGVDGNSTGRWDVYSSGHYTLTSTPCSAVSLSAVPASAAAGTNVTFTATASGCPNPVYQFWMASPGGTWQMVQPYSNSSTFNWNTTGAAQGTYSVSVWTRDASSNGVDANDTGRWDAYTSSQYGLN